MAQFFNFAAIPVPRRDISGITNMTRNIQSGMQTVGMPKQIQQQQQQRALQNQLLQSQAEFAPQLSSQKLQAGALANEYQQMRNRYASQEEPLRMQGLQQQALMNQQKMASQQQEAAQKQLIMDMINQGAQMPARAPLPSAQDGDINFGLTQAVSSGGAPPQLNGQPDHPMVSPVTDSGAEELTQSQLPPAGAEQQVSANIDRMWQSGNPALRKALTDMGYGGKQQVLSDPQTGQATIATTFPSGNVSFDTQQIGMTPYERAFAKAQATANMGAYTKGMDELVTLNNQGAKLAQLTSLEENPMLRNVVGKYGQSTFKQYFGTPEEQALLGEIKSSSGQFSLDLLNSMKGSASERELDNVKEATPTDKDSVAVMIGKTKALNKINKLMADRKSAYLRGISSGMSAVDALNKAQKATPWSSIEDSVKANSSGKVQMIAPDGSIFSVAPDEVDSYLTIGGQVYDG